MEQPVGAAEFAARMAPLGPFEPQPRLAVAVSGGPDSMALALLAKPWVAERGGSVLGLIVDHRLRPDSGAEAANARNHLQAHGIPTRVLVLEHLEHGPALAERARAARYAALEAACQEAGIVHLLIGHQAADQAETVLMRALAGSGPDGLAGMAELSERAGLRLLRPLLALPPGRLRATLRHAGWTWAEDPSNANPEATRARLRSLRLDRDGTGPATRALVSAAAMHGARRARAEEELAQILPAKVTFRPEGFAVLEAGPLPAPVLGAVIATIAGRSVPLSPARLASLAQAPRPAAVGGARLMRAGRLGPGLLIVREKAAMAPAVPAETGAVWDGRFRLHRVPDTSFGTRGEAPLVVGPLGGEAARLRKASPLPFAVLSTLPAIWRRRILVCVPHLGWPDQETAAKYGIVFAPARPLGPAPFVPCRG